MGLPAWSTVGYGSPERPANAKVEPTATRRSPIRRRSPNRLGFTHDPQTGDVRSLRRYSARRSVFSRPIPPQAPLPRHRRPHRPFVHSPLVPSLPSRLDEQVRVTIDALELACSEAARISAQSEILIGPRSRPSLVELQSQIETLSRQYRHDMRGHMVSVENAEQVLRRNARADTPTTEAADRLHTEIVSVLQRCDENLRDLRALLDRLVDAWQQDVSSAATSTEANNADTVNTVNTTTTANTTTTTNATNTGLDRRLQHLHRAISSRADGGQILADLAREDLPFPDWWTPTPNTNPQSLNESGGLGDRTRSASPDHNHADVWDTMRTTLQPDDQLPTADSSFTSAAASASFSASFSAPTESSRSSMESESANSSRTSLTVPPADDAACESDDNQDDTSGDGFDLYDRAEFALNRLPEVIPSPLIPQDHASQERTRPANNHLAVPPHGPATRLPWIEDGPAPTWAARIGRDTPPPQFHLAEGSRTVVHPTSNVEGSYQYSFMPRSQSPLVIAPSHGSSSESSSFAEMTDDGGVTDRHHLDSIRSNHPYASPMQLQRRLQRRRQFEAAVHVREEAQLQALDLRMQQMEAQQILSGDLQSTAHRRASPPPNSVMTRTTLENQQTGSQSRLADSIPAVVRLALRYAGVNSLDDPHADPDLEHMRNILQSLTGDGSVNVNDDDMWVGAGLASMVAENHPSRAPPSQEQERP